MSSSVELTNVGADSPKMALARSGTQRIVPPVWFRYFLGIGLTQP